MMLPLLGRTNLRRSRCTARCPRPPAARCSGSTGCGCRRRCGAPALFRGPDVKRALRTYYVVAVIGTSVQIYSNPYAARCSSMNVTMSSVGGRVPPGRKARTPFAGSPSPDAAPGSRVSVPSSFSSGRSSARVAASPDVLQHRNDSAEQPIFLAIERIAAHCVSCSFSCLNAHRTPLPNLWFVVDLIHEVHPLNKRVSECVPKDMRCAGEFSDRRRARPRRTHRR